MRNEGTLHVRAWKEKLSFARFLAEAVACGPENVTKNGKHRRCSKWAYHAIRTSIHDQI